MPGKKTARHGMYTYYSGTGSSATREAESVTVSLVSFRHFGAAFAASFEAFGTHKIFWHRNLRFGTMFRWHPPSLTTLLCFFDLMVFIFKFFFTVLFLYI